MQYQLKSAKLQDVQTKTVELWGTCDELGAIVSGNLVIQTEDLFDGIEATDVFQALNLSDAEALTPTVGSGALTLDGSTALTASKKIHLVIKLK